MAQPPLAMIGMAVMGRNFAMNFAKKGFDIALFNRTDSHTLEAYESARDEPFVSRLHPVTGEMRELVKAVGKTGVYLTMVKAGEPTQMVIDQLAPLLGSEAVIVDCSNAHYRDTMRREQQLRGKVHFFGVGVSGGEEGARHGPSIMVGGSARDIYRRRLQKALEAVAARAPQDEKPCVAFLGNHGAGHYVKMVHNGIEYADMQLIAEAYDLMRTALGMTATEIADVFAQWNKGPLQSYLVEITAEVLHQRDLRGKGQLVDSILDEAQMKGTGTWMVQSSLEISSGVIPIPGIYAAVESRAISARKEWRGMMAKQLPIAPTRTRGGRKDILRDLEQALYVSKIACYAQGIDLMQAADREYKFGGLDIATIAEIWRAGCIIRAHFLGDMAQAYRKNRKLESLMLAPVFARAITQNLAALERTSAVAMSSRVPFMAFDACRNYLLQSTRDQLPANLTQAQRDYFGAHTYRRTDRKGTFHTEWSQPGRPERRLD